MRSLRRRERRNSAKRVRRGPAYSLEHWAIYEFRDGTNLGPRHLDLETAFNRRALVYKLLWIVQSGANYLRIAREPRGRRQLWTQVRRLLE